MTQLDIEISPDVAQLLGPHGDLSIREAIHAEAPMCWTCGERIDTSRPVTISIIARRDRTTGATRVGCSHADCASSRIELVDYDPDELQDSMRDHEYMFADAGTCLFAFMEPHNVLVDQNTGTSLNQQRLLEIGCHPVRGTWPDQLDAPLLEGWSRRVDDDRLEIIIAGTTESIGSWPLGHVTPERALHTKLLLLVGERIGLVEFDQDRFALSVHAGAVVGGSVPPTKTGRAGRGILGWLSRQR